MNIYLPQSRGRGRDPYFSIVNLEKADICRQVQVGKPPVVEVGEDILGCKRKWLIDIASQFAAAWYEHTV